MTVEQAIINAINKFDREHREHTNISDAWDLLNWIRDQLQAREQLRFAARLAAESHP